MIAVQIHAGSTSQECSNHFPGLQYTPWSPLSSPCLRVVWPKSPHSRTSPSPQHGVDIHFIGRWLPFDLVYESLNFFKLSIKLSLLLIRNAGGQTMAIVSPFGGCAQYTSQIGYVANPSSSSMTRQITLIGVDVSYRLQITWLRLTQRTSHCCRMDRCTPLWQCDILPHTVQSFYDWETYKPGKCDCPWRCVDLGDTSDDESHSSC